MYYFRTIWDLIFLFVVVADWFISFLIKRLSVLAMGKVLLLSVIWVFKHINDIFAGGRRVEWQADRRVPDSTRGNRGNIHNDCWVSLIQF